MLKILDKEKRIKWILNDEDEEPVSIDDLILKDDLNQQENEKNDKSRFEKK